MTLADLVRETLEMFTPPSQETVSEWADHYRIIVGKSNPEPGPWHTDRAPYQREIMDSFTQRGVHTTVVMSAAQMGKTDIEINFIGRTIHLDPGPSLLVMPRDADVRSFSMERLTPTIEAMPVLRDLVYEGDGTTILYKSFPNGFLSMTGAESPAGLKTRPVANLICDEVDGYPASAGNEGDPVSLAAKRTQNFPGRRRHLYISTPTLKKSSRIYKLFSGGTREEWEFQCKHCGAFHKIEFDDIVFEKRVILDDGVQKKYEVTHTAWRCPDCKGEMGEYEVKRAPAKWVAYNPKALKQGVRSFHVTAFSSPWAKWKELCERFLDGKDDAEQLKTFYNLDLGLPFEYSEQTTAPERMYARREHYNAEVPNGVLAITIGVDTQGDRMEYEVKGWGRDEESWGIKYGVLMGRADEDDVWARLDELVGREWQLENGRRLRAAYTFVDSGGNYYDRVVENCYKRRHQNVFAIKGDNKDTGPLVQKTRSKVKNYPLFLLNVMVGKHMILENASLDIPGKRFMHYPDNEEAGYSEYYFRGLLSEEMRFVKEKGVYVQKWTKIRERNEPLDICNYARCAFKGFHFDLEQREKALYGPKAVQAAPMTQGTNTRPRGLISPGITV